MITPFNVISTRSGTVRAVYAVSFHENPFFLIFRDGEWIWEESRWYKPVDATQVVHGQWIKLPSMAPEYECSECGQSYEWWEVSEAHYCPNCGAKMDGGTNGKT